MVFVTIKRMEEVAPVATTDNNKGKSRHEKKDTMEVELLLKRQLDSSLDPCRIWQHDMCWISVYHGLTLAVNTRHPFPEYVVVKNSGYE